MKKGYLFSLCTVFLLAELAERAGYLPPLRPDAGMAVWKVVLSAMAIAAGVVLPRTKGKEI